MKRSIDEKKLEQALRELGAAFPMRVFPMRQGEPEEKRTRLVAFTALRLTASAAAMLLLVALLFTLLPERLPKEDAAGSASPTFSISASTTDSTTENSSATPDTTATTSTTVQTTSVPSSQTTSVSSSATVPATTQPPAPSYTSLHLRSDDTVWLYNGITGQYVDVYQLLCEAGVSVPNRYDLSVQKSFSSIASPASEQYVWDFSERSLYVITHTLYDVYAVSHDYIYDCRTGRVTPLPSSHMAYTPDGRYALDALTLTRPTGDDVADPTVIIYDRVQLTDMQTGDSKIIYKADLSHPTLYNDPYFSLSGRFAIGGPLYDIDKGQELVFQAPCHGTELHFFHDDRYLLTGSQYDPTVPFQLWDTQTGEELTGAVTLPSNQRYYMVETSQLVDDTWQRNLSRLDMQTMTTQVICPVTDRYWRDDERQLLYTYNIGDTFLSCWHLADRREEQLPLDPQMVEQVHTAREKAQSFRETYTLYRLPNGEIELHASIVPYG